MTDGGAFPGVRGGPRAALPTDPVGTAAAAGVLPLLAALVAWPLVRLAAALTPPDAEVLAEKGFLREFLWQAPLSN